MTRVGCVQEHHYVVAVVRVVHPTGGVAGGLTGGVLQREPGMEDAPKLDQAEQEEEQEREHQGKLNQPLTANSKLAQVGP